MAFSQESDSETNSETNSETMPTHTADDALPETSSTTQGHTADHTAGHSADHAHGTKAVVAALFANLGVALAKMFGFVITRSSSMLAESIHSFADSSNQALLLFGQRRARKPPTAKHPFGYGRERYFWSFIVALVLFSLGSLFAIYEGIEKIRHPHELKSLTWAIGILVGGIILELFSFRIAVKESNAVRGNRSWWSFVRRSKSPELPVILLEDLGALLGLCIALVAVVVADVTGNPRWDGVGTLTIGVLLGLIACVLAVEMQSLLIGESADPKNRQKLMGIFERSEHSIVVQHLRTQHMGPSELLVAARIHFNDSLTAEQTAVAIDELHDQITREIPIAKAIYLEPDLGATSKREGKREGLEAGQD